MRITGALLREYFGPKAKIRRRLAGGWEIKTSAGGRVVAKKNGFTEFSGGADVYVPVMKLWRALHGDSPMVASGPIHHVMKAVMEGQRAGVTVEPGGSKRFFGLVKTPPTIIPQISGSQGTAGIAPGKMLAAAHLTGGKRGKGVRLGEDDEGRVIRYVGDNSVTIIGPPGTGKMTTLAAALIVEYEEGSLVILDPKAELLAITKRAREKLGPVRVLCPFKEGLPEELAHYADETDSINPLALLDPKSESFEMDCDSLSETLIAPDAGGESKESGFFTGNAQALVSGVLMQLVLNYPETANLPELASIICSDRIFAFASTALKTGNQYVKDRLASFGSPDAPQLKGGIGDILRTAREQLKWLSGSAIARVLQTPKRLWRFQDLKSRRGTVYVVLPAKYLASSRRFFRLLLGVAVSGLQSSPKGRYPVTCLADEFALLGRVAIFETVFAEGRGHGFKVIPLVQNIGQLKSLYGREGYRNFLSGSEIQIFLPPRDFETAQEISRLAGRRTILTQNFSESAQGGTTGWGGISFGETGQDVLTPHDVIALRPDQFIMYAPGMVKDIIVARRKPYWKSDIAALCDPNPYAPGYKPPRPSSLPKRRAPQKTGLEGKIERWRASRPKKVS